MDHADDGDNDNVFIYMGGDQEVPDDVTHVRVHKSVKIITNWTFYNCINLVSIEMHDGVEFIEEYAFYECPSLRNIKLPGVRVIGEWAFNNCTALAVVEFGDKLETIGNSAFSGTALRSIKIPKIRVIGKNVFCRCAQLTDVELSEDLETVDEEAFFSCPRLRRVAMPLKANMLRLNVFCDCDDLSQVDLVGGIHKTIYSLLLDSWRNEMNDKIDRINRDLPNPNPNMKSAVIRQWMRSVIRRIEHYKSEHYALLKKFTTLLELALWKIKLDEEFGEAFNHENEVDTTNNTAAKISIQTVRQEKRITSGANVVIKNVLPFLKLE